MKIANIVGTRPQYVKLAPVLRTQLSRIGISVVNADTGQHYDEAMSNVFYKNFGLQTENLQAIRDAHHLTQFGDMITKIGQWLETEKPEYVLVFGDTNSTLAAALCAAKLQIPLGHVEAGIRTGMAIGPQEEINRIVTDQISDHLFVTDEACQQNLANEGIDETKVFNVGDVMQDAFQMFYPSSPPLTWDRKGKPLVLLTLHRSENTDNKDVLQSIVAAVVQLSEHFELYFPIHPRSKNALSKHGLLGALSAKINVIEPLSYLDLLSAYKAVDLVISDSGGVPKEAAYAATPSIVLRANPIWADMGEAGIIKCCPPQQGKLSQRLQDAADKLIATKHKPWPYSRNASEKIVDTILGTAH